MKTPPIVPTVPSEPRATSATPAATLELPIAPTHRDILRAVGSDVLLGMIANGQSQANIAALLGVDAGTLGNYLAQDTDRASFALAYQRSAEALTDRAEAIINSGDVDTITAAQVAYLKLQADFLMRKAGQRNAKYREKAPADDTQTGQAPAAAPSFVITIAAGAHAVIDGHTIEAGAGDE